MSILDLSKLVKTHSKKKRLGRGYSSGYGKTCGKGHKGQKSRSGVSPSILYRKTGQVPLYRRIPHRGFSSLAQIRGDKHYGLSIERISTLVSKGILKENILKSDLVSNGIIKSLDRKIKLIGGEKDCVKFTIEVDSISAGARNKLENKGGKVVIINSSIK